MNKRYTIIKIAVVGKKEDILSFSLGHDINEKINNIKYTIIGISELNKNSKSLENIWELRPNKIKNITEKSIKKIDQDTYIGVCYKIAIKDSDSKEENLVKEKTRIERTFLIELIKKDKWIKLWKKLLRYHYEYKGIRINAKGNYMYRVVNKENNKNSPVKSYIITSKSGNYAQILDICDNKKKRFLYIIINKGYDSEIITLKKSDVNEQSLSDVLKSFLKKYIVEKYKDKFYKKIQLYEWGLYTPLGKEFFPVLVKSQKGTIVEYEVVPNTENNNIYLTNSNKDLVELIGKEYLYNDMIKNGFYYMTHGFNLPFLLLLKI